jgi:hypothetical protein
MKNLTKRKERQLTVGRSALSRTRRHISNARSVIKLVNIQVNIKKSTKQEINQLTVISIASSPRSEPPPEPAPIPESATADLDARDLDSLESSGTGERSGGDGTTYERSRSLGTWEGDREPLSPSEEALDGCSDCCDPDCSLTHA